MLGFTLLAAVATGILFSIAPVHTALKTPPSATLRGEAGRSATTAAGTFRAALMAVEVALAVVVLAGAGLMLKSMWRLIAVDPGPGAQVAPGSTVTIVVSTGPADPEPPVDPEPTPDPTEEPTAAPTSAPEEPTAGATETTAP